MTLTKAEEKTGVKVKAGSEPAEFVLIGGVPLEEPTVQYGPFVMNSQEQIQQAFMDYRMGYVL